MQGPHSLTNTTIARNVDNRIGVYLLYNSHGGPVRYVGMSSDLADRLRKWTDEYRFVEFEYYPNRTEAYEREARLYHQHGETAQLDNKRHPPRPHQQVTCPVCDVHG